MSTPSSSSPSSSSPSSSSSSQVVTQVLKCDPSSITFPPSSSSSIDAQPSITCPQTLQALQTASHHLSLSNLVVFPTETVYGLGAPALSTPASSKIFSTKGRPPDNPLIVHISSLAMLNTLLPPQFTMPKTYEILIRRFWPGAMTLLFPRNEDVVPGIITAGQNTVGIRMPSHPVARALIAISNSPLAAPSANTSGKPSPTRAEHVLRDLDGRVGIILDGGPCGVGLESTVVDGLGEDGHLRVLRPGGITVEDLERALEEGLPGGNRDAEGKVGVRVLVHRRDYSDEKMESAPTTPGMKYRHYSPSVPVVLLLTIRRSGEGEVRKVEEYLQTLGDEYNSNSPIKSESEAGSSTPSSIVKIGIMAPSHSKIWGQLPQKPGVEWVRYDLGNDSAHVAQRLFDGLLSLECGGVQGILVEEVGEEREGLAVMNRVRKAASVCVRVEV
ncbi:hypothetical protein CVT24_002871 [Panaeolus cyanescens]|uniref:Threonylcarbamoyl-AMP synthase n=1 Tax=Panaeolus cyanescens TaxID=181874 RepID=A0A409YRL6_9AGAR|nr:hypothetical protein CVT24_002871 [Panaeolus cyanescens]